MPARIVQGSLLCDGKPRHIRLGFRPDIIYAWLDGGSASPVYWSRGSWCERTQFLAATASDTNAIAASTFDGYMQLGTNSIVNVAGRTLHYLAITDNNTGVVANTAYMGNGGTISPTVGTTAPSWVVVKRDSPRPPVLRATGMTQTAFMDGSAVSATAITAINGDGTITCGNSVTVNELSGGTIGEGHDVVAFWNTPGVAELVSWVGDGASTRTISHTVSSPVAAIGMGDTTGTPGFIKMASMGAGCAQFGGTTLASAVTGLLTLGDATYNTLGVTYYAIVIGAAAGSQIAESPPASTTAKAVLLSGAASHYVDCGTSDTLSMAGAFSLEWVGQVRVTKAGTTLVPTKIGVLMARSNGDEGRADSDPSTPAVGVRLDGTWSWGIFAGYVNDLLDWANPQFQILTTNYCNAFDGPSNENDIATKPWRTGILIPREEFHVLVTHNGVGRWNLYLNGVLRKQRNINMTGKSRGDDAGTRANPGPGTGHRTVLGARQGSSAIGSNERVVMRLASVYGSALTQAQAAAMYRRNFLRDTTVSDITPTERWDAESASGSSWPAQINSANNGTINGGAVVLRGNFIYASTADNLGDPYIPPPPDFSLNFTTGTLPTEATLTRASAGTFIDGSGLLASASTDVARFTRNAQTLAIRGLILETAATNLVPDSRSFVASNITIATTQAGSDGASNVACLATEIANTNTHLLSMTGNISFVSLNVYRITRLIKPGTATRAQLTMPSSAFNVNVYANFSLTGTGSVLANGAGASSVSIEPAGNGYYRCGFTATCATTVSAGGPVVGFINADAATRLPSFLGTGLTLIVDHAQVVLATADSAIIPTTGASASRSADILTITTIADVNTLRLTYDDASTDDIPVTVGPNVITSPDKVLVSAVAV